MSGPTPAKARYGLPARWLNCPRIGKIVADKFLPFKTPLCDLYNSQIPPEKRFLPRFVFEVLDDSKEIGLWIDFTNTDRFYRVSEVQNRFAKYEKFRLRGHGESPPTEQTADFVEICCNFFEENPDKIIAVHCTHGFNRTGFLIAAYLVQECGFSASDAVAAFAEARPPGIYKQHYLNDFFERYGDGEISPSAPPLPNWDNEEDETSKEDVKNSTVNSGNQSRESPKFLDGSVPSVSFVEDHKTRSELQSIVHKMCGYRGKGFPGSQPVSMDPENLALLAQKPYKVSWKADGVRYMMLIKGENEIFVFNRSNNVFQVPNLFFPSSDRSKVHLSDTLVDGEVVVDVVQNQSIVRFLIYDVLTLEGENMMAKDFVARLRLISDEIIKPRAKWISEGKIDRASEPFGVRLKDFWDVVQVEKILGEKFQSTLPHEIDGLIFQPIPDAYKCGRCDSTVKWKPHNLNSVDFKLKIVKYQRPGHLPEWIGELYVLGRDQPYSSVKATRVMKQYDRKIVECAIKDDQWEILRERTDKNTPNHISTADAVMQSISNPVTKDMLIEFCRYRAMKPDNDFQSGARGHKRGYEGTANGVGESKKAR